MKTTFVAVSFLMVSWFGVVSEVSAQFRVRLPPRIPTNPGFPGGFQPYRQPIKLHQPLVTPEPIKLSNPQYKVRQYSAKNPSRKYSVKRQSAQPKESSRRSSVIANPSPPPPPQKSEDGDGDEGDSDDDDDEDDVNQNTKIEQSDTEVGTFEKVKGWAKNHPVWASIIGLFAVMFLIGLFRS